MINFIQAVEETAPRTAVMGPEGYEFVSQALTFTRKKMKKAGAYHRGELSEDADFAIDQYGPMAKSVLRHWGIHKTEDFGHIVFNLIEKKIFFKTENDSIDDFKGSMILTLLSATLMEKIFLRKNSKNPCKAQLKW